MNTKPLFKVTVPEEWCNEVRQHIGEKYRIIDVVYEEDENMGLWTYTFDAEPDIIEDRAARLRPL